MTTVAVVFNTNGRSPKEGHRFTELQFVELKRGSKPVSFTLAEGEAHLDQFKGVLEALKTADQFLVHDAANWKRFLRAEIRQIKGHGAKKLLDNVIDVQAWAHSRFPKQRRNLVALAQKAGVARPTKNLGLPLMLECITLLAPLVTQKEVTEAVNSIVPPPAPLPPVDWKKQSSIAHRIGQFWRNLTGKVAA